LLATPTQLNINFSSDRFAMFNKERDIGAASGQGAIGPTCRDLIDRAFSFASGRVSLMD
jgi:hypothetical protein